MKRIEDLAAYEVLESRKIPDLNSDGYLCRHKKTGAKVVLLSNDDDNKVFYIGFRTPPKDSTGVAHILEHSVLCGSAAFPAKDPFVELIKGSLNTFLNAMTYPDKTVYPVASCNDKDFQNLIHVYLDAVFYPNIYKEEKIFRQEGWHYELEDEKDELKLNGVVYNEMKGAFSSPDDVLDRQIFNALFPDTAYGVESGGDPQVIPELTYEDFLAFHKRFYHPSNSYIYLYGDMDMAEKLEWMDREYLSRFDALDIDSMVAAQKAFDKPLSIQGQYPITEAESNKDSTYLAYNTVVGSSLDSELCIAFKILDYVICSAPGAPLKQALIDKGIGKDVYSTYENGIYQPYFSIVAKGANAGDREAFEKTIVETLRSLVKEGIDKKALLAGENFYEFKYREADFGSFPKGLMYGLDALDSWLYDENQPFMHIEQIAVFTEIKNKINTDYFERLIQEYLLDNSHKALIMLEPVMGLTTEKDKMLQERLKAYQESLTAEQIKDLIMDTNALHQYQAEPSPREILEMIPLLKREDIKKEAEPFLNVVDLAGETTVLKHEIFTNGIAYVSMLFDMSHVNQSLLPYVGLLKNILGYVDTEHFGYGDLFNEINIWTGGVSSQVSTYTNSKKLDEYKVTFEVKVSALFENLEKAVALLEELLFTSKLEDEKRLLEIISEQKSRMQASFVASGNSLAAIRAMSYFSETASVSEMISGIPFYRLLEDLESDFENKKDILIGNLKQLVLEIFRPENFLVDFTAEKGADGLLKALLPSFCRKLYTQPVEKHLLHLETTKKNEGFTTSAQIQYVCRAGNFLKKGLAYTGALKVLKVIMGYEYLWNLIRVKGGAYGCMCNFTRIGDCYFVSYRDPNLDKTIDVYEGAAEYLRHFDADERTMDKFVIGTISSLDTPLTPYSKGTRSLNAYLSNVEFEEIQKERDEILGAQEEDIRALAAHIEAFMQDGCICVVGNEDKIKESGDLFMHVESLFH